MVRAPPEATVASPLTAEKNKSRTSDAASLFMIPSESKKYIPSVATIAASTAPSKRTVPPINKLPEPET